MKKKLKYLSFVGALLLLLVVVTSSVFAQTTVSPADTLQGSGADDIDDMAVWIHPTDKTKSIVIGSDKYGNKIFVWDLDGNLLQTITGVGQPGNIDLAYNFPINGNNTDVVVVNERNTDLVLFYRVNPSTRNLERIDNGNIKTSGENYGVCLYKSPASGKFYAFLNHYRNGIVEQFELSANASGKITGTIVRDWDIGGQTEGCVADYENQVVYFAEEENALWRYGAEPTDSTSSRTEIVGKGDHGFSGDDAEGVTIYYKSDGGGYLILSDQGNNEFMVFDRNSNAYIDTFRISGVSDTDGIDVSNVNFGSKYPSGMFLAHNNSNSDALTVVNWQTIASALDLDVDTAWDPRGGFTPGPTNSPTTPPATLTPTNSPTNQPTNQPTPTATSTGAPLPSGSSSSHLQTVTGTSEGANSVSSGTLSSSNNSLVYVAAVSTRASGQVESVNGLGLNWSRASYQCSGRNATGVDVWYAVGQSQGGSVTANLGSSRSSAVISVSVFNAASATSVLGANTNGEAGACSGGTDTDNYSVSFDASGSGLIYSAVATRNKTHSPVGGLQEISEVSAGSGGDVAGLSASYATVSGPNTYQLEGDISSATDWALVALEISGSGTNITPNPSQSPVGEYTGDADSDGDVDEDDFAIWNSNRDQNVSGGQSDGDFNQDGVVDGVDYVIWLNSYGDTINPTVTPGPTSTADSTITPEPTATATPGPTPPPGSQGLWLSPQELSALPTSGSAWDDLVDAANSSWGTAHLDDNDSNHDVYTVAGALVAARTGDSAMRSKVVNALESAMNSDIFRALELARGLQSYIIAADLIGYRTPQFEDWIREMLKAPTDQYHSGGSDICNTYGESLSSSGLGDIEITAFRAPNNWGGHARASVIAAALYLDDQSLLDTVVNAHKAFIGLPVPNYLHCQDTNWHADPNNKWGVNRLGSEIQGQDVSGVLPEDWRRGTEFRWPPEKNGYMWEGMQGYVVSAVLLHRAGIVPFDAGDNAVVRSLSKLYEVDFPPGSDDAWIPWLVNYFAGADFPTSSSIGFGKNMGWTNWSHQGSGGGTPAPTATPAPTDTPAPTETPVATATPSPEPEEVVLKLSFASQGVTQGTAQHQLNTEVTLIESGEEIEFEENILFGLVNGRYEAEFVATGIIPDTYDVYVKGPYHLRRKVEDVVLVAGENEVTFDEQAMVGDFDGDNILDIQDVSAILSAYTALSVTPTQGTRKYDVNWDGAINIIDVSLVLANYTELNVYGD